MDHPYKQYENSKLWNVIDKGIEDLVQNNDLNELTKREYIVGYLCEKLSQMEDES